MNKPHITTAVVCALTTLLLVPLEATAGGRASGMRSSPTEAIAFLEAIIFWRGSIFDLSAIRLLVRGHGTATTVATHTTVL